MVFGLGRLATDGDGDKGCSVSGEQREQKGVMCNWKMNELVAAKAEGQKVEKYPAEILEDMNSRRRMWLKDSRITDQL